MRIKSRKLAPVVRSPIVKFAHAQFDFRSIAPSRKNNAAFLSHWSENWFLLQWDVRSNGTAPSLSTESLLHEDYWKIDNFGLKQIS